MARTKINSEAAPKLTPLPFVVTPPEVETEKDPTLPPLVNPTPKAASVWTPPGPDDPKPMRYMVMNEKAMIYRGSATLFKRGRVLDDLNFNIEELKKYLDLLPME